MKKRNHKIGYTEVKQPDSYKEHLVEAVEFLEDIVDMKRLGYENVEGVAYHATNGLGNIWLLRSGPRALIAAGTFRMLSLREPRERRVSRFTLLEVVEPRSLMEVNNNLSQGLKCIFNSKFHLRQVAKWTSWSTGSLEFREAVGESLPELMGPAIQKLVYRESRYI
ncbi:hypothetical protein MMC10_001627 [Thelotrema lepadinum]|nr:hypothetical protein [Thelotrema lepadinum]